MANRRKVDRKEQAQAAMAFGRSFALRLGQVLAFAGLLFAVGAAGRGLFLFVTTSPRFAISNIEITGAERATESDLRRRLGIVEGDNLFTADVTAAREALLTHPWVRDARVERRFPQGLKLTLLERRAVALVDLGSLYLLDERAEVFKRALPEDPSDLPLITGLSREEWVERPEEARERLSEAVGLLEVYASSGASRELPAAELHLDSTDGATLYLGDEALAVRVGRGGAEQKLRKLSRVLDELARRGERAEVIHLDNRARPGWIAARLKEAPETALGAPQRKGRVAAP